MRRLIASVLVLVQFTFSGAFSPADLALNARDAAMGRLGMAGGPADKGGLASFGVNPAVLGLGGRGEIALGLLPISEGTFLTTGQFAATGNRWGMGVQGALLNEAPSDMLDSWGAKIYFPEPNLAAYVGGSLGFVPLQTKTVSWGLGATVNLFPKSSLANLKSEAVKPDFSLSTLFVFQMGPHQTRVGLGMLRITGEEVPGERVKVAMAGIETDFQLGTKLSLALGIEGTLERETPGVSASVEVGISGFLFLRGGFRPLTGVWGQGAFTAGGGVKLGRLGLDYALLPEGNGSDFMHQLSLRLAIGK